MPTDAWISRTLTLLGLIVAVSVVSILVLMRMGYPISEILVALGSVSTGGLVWLWISPLNRNLLE